MFDVRLASVLRHDSSPGDVDSLHEALGIPVHAEPSSWPSPKRSASRAASWVSGGIVGTPNWIVERRSQRLASHLSSASADVGLIFGEAAGVYAGQLRGRMLVVWDKSNVLGASSRELWAGRAIRSRLAESSALRFERRVLPTVDRVTVTSEVEARRLQAAYQRQADAIVPSPIDVFPPASWGRSRRIGWMSSFSYSANSDGLIKFLRDGWPKLAANGFTLEIVGVGRCSSGLRDEIARSANVSLLGFVENLHDWMDGLQAAVIPLWAGAGVKLKTLHWLMSTIPTVGTSVAFEGIPVVPGKHAAVADGPEEMAAEILRLDQSETAVVETRGAAARRLILEGFSTETVVAEYGRHLQKWHAG
ncbi:hypothetical protein GCM10027259_09530 [Micromonospora palomenae]|nr:glycosyltransferase [Micromonospora palomenae]